MGDLKVCRSCGLLLPISDFNRRADSHDGHDWYCRKCHARMHAAWRERVDKTDPRVRDVKQTAMLRSSAMERFDAEYGIIDLR